MNPDRQPALQVTLLVVAALVLGGCDQVMTEQPKRTPLQESSFFADGQSSRIPVPGTVPQGGLKLDDHLYRGIVGGELAGEFPFPVTAEVLSRGRERFSIFCAPCHDRTGYGHGRVVARGYRNPPSYHIDRLRKARPGHFFDVITRGFGAMPDYADQIPARDCWAIVAFIRALQLSQNAGVEEVPPEELSRLEALPE